MSDRTEKLFFAKKFSLIIVIIVLISTELWTAIDIGHTQHDNKVFINLAISYLIEFQSKLLYSY